MLRKLFIFAIAVGFILTALLAIAVRHVKPTEDLNLDYNEITISSKITDIVKNRKLEVQLTEQDLNEVVKKQLAAHQVLPNDFRIEGAKLTLQGSNLVADVNVRWREKIPIGAQMMFTLAWNPPNLVVQHRNTSIKGMQVPSEWVQLSPFKLPIEDHLPKLIGVKNVLFEEKAIIIQLKPLR
ncbi:MULTISPECIES: hypothetical protein [unclassified Paenibacillus]|uniref:hypothetical protein n=1 Tax=unclassified Paenibacillus TaxID=185978 RepID=UPI0027838068|nr:MULTISPECIES: hypothetical protein [unclassified Paenibacillus]MDQ0901594.1 hypothetical protein [Paenibacillus sp. V4I7]MDQ0919905.1 hypothetical protein [Paenibacillus sp. V4I5]